MNWQEILTIIIPIIGFLGWIYGRLDKRFERLENQINDVRKDIQSLDSRVSRIEGQLSPYHWEPKIKQKEE